MNDISQYIDVLIQAPLAVILIVFIYLSFKNVFTPIILKLSGIIDKLTTSIKELTDVIKRLKP